MSVQEAIALREIPAVNIQRHAALCNVCKSSYAKEIERAYLLCRPVADLAEEYEVPDTSIYRHMSYFGLNLQKAASGHLMLLDAAERGFRGEITPTVALGCVTEYNRITGKHIGDRKHPVDAQREDDHARIKALEVLAMLHDKNPEIPESQWRSYEDLRPLYELVDGK